jgi:GTP diphosphokinase / guanosine-3',5'-bis(diphosphate) 3'-diphosphatase
METVAVPKYNLNEEQERKLILREYRSLLRSLKIKIKPGDKELLRNAFEIAAEAHKTMRRKSGEPYILHPLALYSSPSGGGQDLRRRNRPGYPLHHLLPFT